MPRFLSLAFLVLSAIAVSAQQPPTAPLPPATISHGQQRPTPTPPPATPPSGQRPTTTPSPGTPGSEQRITRPPGAQTPPPGSPGQRLDGRSSWKNVQIDITIADSVGPDGPAKKTLTLLVMNGRNGQIRSTGREGGIINIDAQPGETGDGRVSMNLTVEYLPELSTQQVQNGVRLGMLSESLTVLLENAKPTIVTQSADPRTDRKVTVEVTATVLK